MKSRKKDLSKFRERRSEERCVRESKCVSVSVCVCLCVCLCVRLFVFEYTIVGACLLL